ncbi:MAG: Gfo/Idh/MocA family oxidoreductase [Gemmataceae bacterium]|nr:Gfo/Idh/MocA family oxidoreductase [Gemmataceae bacterium]MCI0741151.1 Gfo/Idh/MocA family oxidoreductase [Gemmataceae bacterium]
MSVRQVAIGRRRFLKTAVAASAPLIIPAAALGAQGRPAASERITLGFIGMGTMGRGLLSAFIGQKDVQVLAVCDVDTTRRESARKTVEERYAEQMKSGQYRGCSAYNDFREVLNRKDINGVVIATPDHWHAIPVMEACQAQKDIYCEKPLSLTIHEAKLMIDMVRKHKRVFQTGSQQRSSNEFRLACELVRSGRIGKVRTVNVNVGGPSRPCDLGEEKLEPGLDWERWLGPAPRRAYHSVLSPRGVHKHFPAWRDFREYSGGQMTDMGAHHFDIAQWGLNMDSSGPVEIIPPKDPKASTGVRFVYANGVEVVHGPGGGIQFIGSNGEITVNRGLLRSKPESIIKEPIGEKDVRLPRSPGHQRDFLDCMRTRRNPICDVEIGARSVTVCHLGNLAYWHQRRLRWNPRDWQFVGADGDNRWLDGQRRDPWQLPKV